MSIDLRKKTGNTNTLTRITERRYMKRELYAPITPKTSK